MKQHRGPEFTRSFVSYVPTHSPSCPAAAQQDTAITTFVVHPHNRNRKNQQNADYFAPGQAGPVRGEKGGDAMKLYWGSLTLYFAYEIARFGNFPHNALRLYPFKHETAKDAAQKLMRAGYVGVVKAPHIKSLYITPAGRKAVDQTLARRGLPPIRKAPIVYYPPKAARADKITETLILFQQANLTQEFESSRKVKRELEQAAARSSDGLKYSRFVGLWRREAACSVVFHFGHGNIRLNPNGELNAMEHARHISTNVERLVLGSNMDTLLSILRYSQKMNMKSERQRRNLRHVNFFVRIGDHCVSFLPVSRDSIPVLDMMQNAAWTEWIRQVQRQFFRADREVWGLLGCHMQTPLGEAMHPGATRQDDVPVLCYDWQEAFAREWFAQITDRKRIWIQPVRAQALAGYFYQDTPELCLEREPYRLTPPSPAGNSVQSLPHTL